MTASDHPSVDRRGFLTAAAGAAVMIGSWWMEPGTAHADALPLPGPGEEIRCVSKARSVVFRSLLWTGEADVTCDIRLKVEADPDDARARRLRVLKHQMRGRSPEFGEISLTQAAELSGAVAVPPSVIRLSDVSPARYDLRLECHGLEVTVQRLPLDLRRAGVPVDIGRALSSGEPLRFVATEPLVLEGRNLDDWRLHHHRLATRGVPLALAGVPGVPVAFVEPFEVDAEHVRS
ncbi:hypothetical protein [Streptomyces sp. S.PB5]|uniref:hypothetical protein n=1 Tax=Streptomyces sp. S.PB5 TaxID=3020844 RepID=UPI0025B1B3D9|nr:hypothetical protein [Streptomyces sp. S.PB5]MDN3022763.1 hypothetical protein [Streptomyces sp. S.PB5]